LTGSSAIGR